LIPINYMKLHSGGIKIVIAVVVLCAAAFFLFFNILGITGKLTPPEEKKLQKINIAFQSWVGYGPLYLAAEKGFFKEEGIEVIFINEELDTARRDAFKAGMLDCEGGTLDLLVAKTSQGAPIVAVLEMGFSYGGEGIVAAEDIKNLKGLAGRKVALTRGDVNETFISYLFYEAKLPLDSLNFIYRSPEKVAQAFLSGEADAAVTWEPWLSEALKRPGAHVLISTKENPGIIVDTLNVRKDLAESNPAVVKGLMRAWLKAVKYYNEHPVEASEIIAWHYNIKPQDYRENINGMRWISYEEQVEEGRYEKLMKVFNDVSEIKFMNKAITNKPKAEEVIDETLLKGLYENSK